MTMTALETPALAWMLGRIAPDIPSELVTRENLADIVAVAGELPAAMASFFGFECGLAAATRTDFALNLTAAGLDALARNAALSGDSCRGIRDFCRLWRRRGSGDAHAGAIWLEFDVKPGSRGAPPSVFFRVEAGEEPAWTIGEAIPTLRGAPLSDAVAANVAHVIDAVRPEATALQIGVMLARPIDAVRVCALGIAPPRLMSLLYRAGWKGSRATSAAIARKYSPHVDAFGVHLDVAQRLSPAAGVEMLYAGREWEHQPHREPRWQRLFAQLVDDRLCTHERREALFGWPGYVDDGLEPLTKLLAPSLATTGIVLRGLQHVKLSVDPEGGTAAKIYFGAIHTQWREDQ